MAEKSPTRTSDLGRPFEVKLEEIALDPNNPRLSPKPAPGYEDPAKIFSDEIQKALVEKVYEVYKAEELAASVIEQGWTPVDQILVWKHPSGQGHIVVEGNTRVSLLKHLPERLALERKRLDRQIRSSAPQSQITQQQLFIGKIEQLIADTETLTVYPVEASDAIELRAKLPRLLGVRHVMPAKGWGPYATNLYIISLYETAYYANRSVDEPLRLEQSILDDLATQLPLKPDQIRKNIQAVSAYSHFRANYEEQIEAAGNKLGPGDQYFFDNILANKYARDEFGFTSDRLALTEEGEKALFLWAFSKPRDAKTGDDEDAINENIFQKAEDIRLWQKVSRYDAKNKTTSFAKGISISEPEAAVPAWRLSADADAHRTQKAPIQTITDLLNGLKKLQLDTLIEQGDALRPMMEEAIKEIQRYVKFINDNQD